MTLAIGIFLTLLLIFAVLVQPIWSLIVCMRHQAHSDNKRMMWMICMILFWCFASHPYAVITRDLNRALRISSIPGILLFLVITSGLLIGPQYIKHITTHEIDKTTHFIQHHSIQISPTHQHSIQIALDTLKIETAELNAYTMEEACFDEDKQDCNMGIDFFAYHHFLCLLLQASLRDNKLSSDEFQIWQDFYTLRSDPITHQKRLELQIENQ